MPSWVFDPRGAEAYLTVRRAPGGEKTQLGAVHRRPQQTAGEKCGLGTRPKKPPGGEPGGDLEAGGAVQLSRQDRNERIVRLAE